MKVKRTVKQSGIGIGITVLRYDIGLLNVLKKIAVNFRVYSS